MGLPRNAFYVLTKIELSLPNSKIHPNSGTPNFNIKHDHLTDFENAGSNTHADIDSHIANSAIHFATLAGFDTDDLTEGTNLYYTDTRARAALSGTANEIDYDALTGKIGIVTNPTLTGTTTITNNLRVDGGNIGITTDPNLIQLTAIDRMQINGNLGIGIVANANARLIANAGTLWSNNNYGASLAATGGRNNAIAILSSGNNKPWAIANIGAGDRLTIAAMPEFGDTANPPINIITFDRTDSSTILAGDLTVGLNTQLNGDLIYNSEGSGIPYGGMHIQLADGFIVSISGTAPVEVFDASNAWITGQLNLLTFTNHHVDITKPGRYQIIWSTSIHTDTGGTTEVHTGIMVNGVAIRDDGEAHRSVLNTQDTGALCGNSIIDLPNGTEEISLWVSNDQSNDLHINHATVSVIMVGGT